MRQPWVWSFVDWICFSVLPSPDQKTFMLSNYVRRPTNSAVIAPDVIHNIEDWFFGGMARTANFRSAMAMGTFLMGVLQVSGRKQSHGHILKWIWSNPTHSSHDT